MNNIKFYTNIENMPNEIYKIHTLPPTAVQVSIIPQNFSFLMDSNKVYLLETVYNIHYNYYTNSIMCYTKYGNVYTTLQNVLFQDDITSLAVENNIPFNQVFNCIWIVSYNGSPFDLTSYNITVKLVNEDRSNIDELPDTKYYDYIGIYRFNRFWSIEIPTKYYGVFKEQVYRTALQAALAYDYFTYKDNPKADTNYSLDKYPKEILNKLGIKSIKDIKEPKKKEKMML